MKKKIMIGLLAIALVVSGFSCSSGKEKSTGSKGTKGSKQDVEIDMDKRRLEMISPFAYSNIDGLNVEPGTYISIIGRENAGSYWEAVKDGANKAISDLNEAKGYEGKDKIKLVYSAPTQLGDVDQQINILDEEMARYPVAIAISAADMKACEVQFDLASENNIVVVAFDTGSQYQGVMANIGTNNVEAIQKVAEEFSEKVAPKSQVLIVSGDSKLKAENDRKNAFFDVLKLDPNEYTLLDPISLDDEETSLENILKENPDIKGIFTTGSQATTEVAQYMTREQEKGITLMGFDLSQETKDGLEQGYVDGIVEQNPYAMGYASVVACIRAALDMGNEAMVDTGFSWVTKDNVKSREIELY